MASLKFTGVLVVGMLVTGCSNSLWSKFQDMQCVGNCDNPDPKTHKEFAQPVIQTFQMFLGETLCLFAFLFITSRFNPWVSTKGVAPPNDSDVARPPPFSKAKYRAISQSAPDDSGIDLNDDRYVKGLSHGTDGDMAPAQLMGGRGEEDVPYRGHGATSASLIAAPDHDDLKADGEGLDGWISLLFWLPALFDISGTTLMNVGLLFTPVSIYQMVRGALPLWVGTFSVLFLGCRLSLAKWLSLVIIMAGVALVGLAGVVEGESSDGGVVSSEVTENNGSVVLGIMLIFFAQLFTASQFCVEEKIMTRFEVPPLRAVGLEGIFGLLTTLVAMPILHNAIGSKPEGRGGYFDLISGWHDVVDFPAVLWSSVAIAFSIAFFNFCGLAVTKCLSATARSVIDTCRSVGIWVISLLIGWETFKWLQLLGFVVLVVGSLLYNDVLAYPPSILRYLGDTDTDNVADTDDELRPEASGSGWQKTLPVRFQRTEEEAILSASQEDTPLLSAN